MKAVVCYGDGVVKYEDIEEPKPHINEVKIRVKACGICGSDIPRAMGRGAHNYPIVLGHEFSGIVSEIGGGVSRIKVGDHVTVAPLIPCHICEDCLKGDFSLCKHYSFIGSRQQGANAEYIVVPEQNVIKMNSSLSFEQGALFEPSTVALHAIYLNDFKPGGNVAVLGGGTIGVFTLQWAKIKGAKKVVVIGRDKKHLELASKLGADEIISTLDNDFFSQAMDESNGQGYDYVFEAAGSTATMKLAFKLSANKGHLCFIGTPKEELSFSISEWELLNRKEFKLTGSWMSYSKPFPGREWIETEENFLNGRLVFDDNMIFAKYPFENADKAFELFNGRVRGKVLLVSP